MDATLALGLIQQLIPMLSAAPETIANAKRMSDILSEKHANGGHLSAADWDEIHAIRKHFEDLALTAGGAEPDQAVTGEEGTATGEDTTSIPPLADTETALEKAQRLAAENAGK